MDSECEGPQEEQIAEDQDEGSWQQEPCGANRWSLTDRKPAQRMTYPYLGQPTFQTLPTLNTLAADSVQSLPLVSTTPHTLGHASNSYQVVPQLWFQFIKVIHKDIRKVRGLPSVVWRV